jgi:hypothetical protein
MHGSNSPQIWIDNVAVVDSSSISATPTATFTFPLANTLYNIFIAYERWVHVHLGLSPAPRHPFRPNVRSVLPPQTSVSK